MQEQYEAAPAWPHLYDVHLTFPPGYTQKVNNQFCGNSVFYYLLPYIEQSNLYTTFDRRFPRTILEIQPECCLGRSFERFSAQVIPGWKKV
ncbi:MAG: hypothetical protein R3C02_13560 [Planctomycetaceae bacterium]